MLVFVFVLFPRQAVCVISFSNIQSLKGKLHQQYISTLGGHLVRADRCMYKSALQKTWTSSPHDPEYLKQLEASSNNSIHDSQQKRGNLLDKGPSDISMPPASGACCSHDHDCDAADCGPAYSLFKHIDQHKARCLSASSRSTKQDCLFKSSS